jgi:hypothetical protein
VSKTYGKPKISWGNSTMENVTLDDILKIAKTGERLNGFVITNVEDTNLHNAVDTLILPKMKRHERPLVLWNVRPWNNFNFLHAIYCHKLKKLVDLGFNCVVILYDKYVEKNRKLYGSDKIAFRNGVENFIQWMRNAGLTHHTEFISETDIWSYTEFTDFADKFLSFAHASTADIPANKNKFVPAIVDNLFEIFYETLIDCDIVLTGKGDRDNIWGMLRKQALVDKVVDNYKPPIVLNFPNDFVGVDNELINTANNSNSLSTNDDESKLSAKLGTAHIDFLKILFNFLIIPISESVRIGGKEFISFDDIKEKCEITDIRKFAFQFMLEYFRKIKAIN